MPRRESRRATTHRSSPTCIRKTSAVSTTRRIRNGPFVTTKITSGLSIGNIVITSRKLLLVFGAGAKTYSVPSRTSLSRSRNSGFRLDERIGRGNSFQLAGGIKPVVHRGVLLHEAIFHDDVAARVRGDVRLVRHHDDGDALLVQALENLHHLDARPAVEISGRLIREDDFRIVD